MFMPVTWKKEFAIGVAEIDKQHLEMFNRFDRFLEAIDQGKGDKELRDVLIFLKDYIVRHFKAEEALQKQFNYPHLEMHLAEHRSFEKQLIELDRHRGPSGELVHLTRNILIQWLIQHICKLDSDLAGFINERRNEVWEEWMKKHF
jgi:hemerythrin